MPDVMEQLHEDHKNVAKLLNFLGASIATAESGRALDLDLVHDVMYYMTHYPDIFHHPREDLVFERLLIRDPQARLSVKVLLEEHTTILDMGQAFLQSLKEARGTSTPDSNTLLSYASVYVSSMQTHMDMEEAEVFPLAKLLLTSSDWTEINTTLQTRADPLFGQVVDDKYKSLARKIDRLFES